ncbi:MAG: hypothetical protein EAX91_16515 [Candidatus Lokiarchaeota archaeon]|nr:hypothetical protein [Candidatus Lokiarchaeota archaeon]
MKKKVKLNLILLISTAILLSSSSITPQTMAQESITIWASGCIVCNQENNYFFVNWTSTGTIPQISIFIYNLTLTTLEYTVVDGTTNDGTFGWNFPASHTLDGEYYLLVCDTSNHNVNDTRLIHVYPIQTYPPPPIPGFPVLIVGLIIGITSIIVAIPLTKKLRKR